MIAAKKIGLKPSECVVIEDAIAGMVVGFVAGAAVVGGGVLLHKLLK